MKPKAPRKTRRQQMAEKTKIGMKRVDAANAQVDPLNKSFRIYKSQDGDITLRCSKVGDLSAETLEWIFDLMERNMKTLYEETWGWNPEEKHKELTEPAAWFLIAKDESEKFVGFSHFRFDMDHGEDVLYCYELQLEPAARRKGLGRRMMVALETMALENFMQKVVLTVCKKNLAAMPFFLKLGYGLDNTNPSESENLPYRILSKKNLSAMDKATGVDKQ